MKERLPILFASFTVCTLAILVACSSTDQKTPPPPAAPASADVIDVDPSDVDPFPELPPDLEDVVREGIPAPEPKPEAELHEAIAAAAAQAQPVQPSRTTPADPGPQAQPPAQLAPQPPIRRGPSPAPTNQPPAQAAPEPPVQGPGLPQAQPFPALPNPAAAEAPADDIIPAGGLAAVGMPLDQFFNVYSEISGRTILRPYKLSGEGITLQFQTDLTREEAIFAMDAALALNDIAMIPINAKFIKAVPSNLAPQEGADIASYEPGEVGSQEQFVTRIVKVQNLKASELAPLLTTFTRIPNGVTAFDDNQTIVLRDHAYNVKRMLQVIEQVDQRIEPEYSLEVIPIRYGKVTDIYGTMNALITGEAPTAFGGAAAGAGAGSAFGSVGRGASFGRGGSFGRGTSMGRSSRGGYGGGYGGGGYGGGYYPQQASTTPVGQAQSSFQDRLRRIVRGADGDEGELKVLENANIVPDERSNSLLVFASKRDMSMITNIVSKVDVLLAQVLIETIILEVKLADSQNIGVSILQNPKQFGNDFSGTGASFNRPANFLGSLTNLPASEGFSYFGNVGDSLDVAVSAIARDSSINIVSRPRIQTSHAIPGAFFIGETVPYVTGFTDYGGFVGSGLSTRSTIQQQQIGLSLFVTPFITPEGFVVMEITQDFDQRGADVVIEGNPIPIVNNRTAEATLTVRDGDTIMMGGFITENNTKSDSGVPVLKDIPGLGALFRSKNNSSDRTELVILMRATVLESPTQAAIVAAAEKSSLLGVQKAEEEFEETRQKRAKELNRRKW